MSVVMTEPDPEADAGFEFFGDGEEGGAPDGGDGAAVEGRGEEDGRFVERGVSERGAAAGGVMQPMVGVDLDGDGRADVPLGGVGLVSPGMSWTEEIEQKRIALRSARAPVLMSRFRRGMSYQEHVAAVGLVVQIELALISFYRESVPDPNVVWDGERRSREIERRLARLGGWIGRSTGSTVGSRGCGTGWWVSAR